MPKNPPTPEPGNAPQGILEPPEHRHPDNTPVVDALVPDPTPMPEAPSATP